MKSQALKHLSPETCKYTSLLKNNCLCDLCDSLSHFDKVLYTYKVIDVGPTNLYMCCWAAAAIACRYACAMPINASVIGRARHQMSKAGPACQCRQGHHHAVPVPAGRAQIRNRSDQPMLAMALQ